MSNTNTTSKQVSIPKRGLIFADEKPKELEYDAKQGHAELKKANHTLLQEVKELRMQTTIALESIAFLKTQILKLVAHKTLTKEHWRAIKQATKESWKNQKSYSQETISALVRETIDLDDLPDDEQQLTLQLAISKVKTYLRTTLLKTFYTNVKKVVFKYFASGKQVDVQNVDKHVQNIVSYGAWATEVPSESDKTFCKVLAKKIIEEQILDNRPTKKRRIDVSEEAYPVRLPRNNNNDYSVDEDD